VKRRKFKALRGSASELMQRAARFMKSAQLCLQSALVSLGEAQPVCELTENLELLEVELERRDALTSAELLDETEAALREESEREAMERGWLLGEVRASSKGGE